MYDRILVATDGSQLSGKAVQHAIGLASAIDSELVALHVIPRYPTSYLEDAIGISRREMDRTEAKWKAHGQEVVDAVQAAAQAKGVKRILLGSETQQVLTHANIPALVVR